MEQRQGERQRSDRPDALDREHALQGRVHAGARDEHLRRRPVLELDDPGFAGGVPALFYLPTGHGWREGIVVGGAMNGRGAVEIIVAGIGLERGLITTEVFTVLVLMAILTTAMVPVLLKVGVEWLRGRGELADAGSGRHTVTIVGAGPVARACARALDGRRDVWLLDSNPQRCAVARREGLQAVAGDALDAEALRRARADEAGLLIAMTPNVGVNVLAVQLARDEFGVRDLRVATGGAPEVAPTGLMERIGAVALFDGAVDVEQWNRWMDDGRATVTTVVVGDEDDAARLGDRLRTGQVALPLAVLRGEDGLPWWLLDRLRVDDEVVVVARQPEQRLSARVPDPTPAA